MDGEVCGVVWVRVALGMLGDIFGMGRAREVHIVLIEVVDEES